MRRSLLLGMVAMGAATVSFASCGGGVDVGPGSGGSGGGTSSSAAVSTAASTSSSGGTGGTGGVGGTGGSSFCAGAPAIDFGSPADGDLLVTGQQDLYRFQGTKGQVVMIDIDAQVHDGAEFDPTYLDSVVTLFDAAGTQLAQNNDPVEFSTGDSRLYTILPADGEYCARVADCWTVLPNPGQSCAGTKDKAVTTYTIFFQEIVDVPGDADTAEVESGDDAASAVPIDYAKDGNDIYATTVWGTFRDQDDVDVFSFTLPTDLTPMPPADVRTTGIFYLMQGGPTESGATVQMGSVAIVDPGAPGVALAEVDAAKNVKLVPRLELGKPYLLVIKRPKGTVGKNDFYFVRHRPSWGNPLELEKQGTAANDTIATAEALTLTGSDAYIEGDVSTAGQDVDHFVVSVPPGMTKVSASCGARRYGSGLRDMKLSLLAAGGGLLTSAASDVESETNFASVPAQPVGSTTQVILKVEAMSQAPTVTSAFYQCGIHFKP